MNVVRAGGRRGAGEVVRVVRGREGLRWRRASRCAPVHPDREGGAAAVGEIEENLRLRPRRNRVRREREADRERALGREADRGRFGGCDGAENPEGRSNKEQDYQYRREDAAMPPRPLIRRPEHGRPASGRPQKSSAVSINARNVFAAPSGIPRILALGTSTCPLRRRVLPCPPTTGSRLYSSGSSLYPADRRELSRSGVPS